MRSTCMSRGKGGSRNPHNSLTPKSIPIPLRNFWEELETLGIRLSFASTADVVSPAAAKVTWWPGVWVLIEGFTGFQHGFAEFRAESSGFRVWGFGF